MGWVVCFQSVMLLSPVSTRRPVNVFMPWTVDVFRSQCPCVWVFRGWGLTGFTSWLKTSTHFCTLFLTAARASCSMWLWLQSDRAKPRLLLSGSKHTRTKRERGMTPCAVFYLKQTQTNEGRPHNIIMSKACSRPQQARRESVFSIMI